MLRIGYLVDLVIWDRDLLTVPPEDILEAQADLAIVGGKVVYRR